MKFSLSCTVIVLPYYVQSHKTIKMPQGTLIHHEAKGVDFKICANTLKGRKIALDDLYFAEKLDVFPSGVAEIRKLRQ